MANQRIRVDNCGGRPNDGPASHRASGGCFSCVESQSIGTEEGARIETIRLDFLEPLTQVNTRFEASVSHRILATGGHYSVTI